MGTAARKPSFSDGSTMGRCQLLEAFKPGENLEACVERNKAEMEVPELLQEARWYCCGSGLSSPRVVALLEERPQQLLTLLRVLHAGSKPGS